MATQKRRHARHIIETIRRAFSEFLTLPSMVIFGFVLLAGFTYGLDSSRECQTRGLANGALFADQDAVRNFLGVIATSIITLTSITFALLLIAVQQGATALTNQVFDQFLRRRANQLYFGFFIGLALYAMIVLATTGPSHDSAYGVAVAFLMTIVALYLLMTLIYTTIDQMRPVMIIKAIREHALFARECQKPLLRQTRRLPRGRAPISERVSADASGFLVRIDAAAIVKATASISGEIEIVLLQSVGGYIALLRPDSRNTDRSCGRSESHRSRYPKCTRIRRPARY
jgi:uncharacterized membrane protein